MPDTTLKAFCNGYEVIAAGTEDEARSILRALGWYDDEEDLDGDGWEVLADDEKVRDEDGNLTGDTVGNIVAAAGKPCHLWSVEV